MGFCRKAIGKAHIESRRESFHFGIAYDKEGGDPCPRIYCEVEYKDLDDVIAALIDLRDNDPRYHDWVEAGRRDPIMAQAERVWASLRPAQRLDLAESVSRRGLRSLLKLEKMRQATTYARQPWLKLRDDERRAVACAIDNGWRA